MKDWLQKLNDPSRDVYERRYRLVSAASILMLFLWLIVAVLIDGYSPRILFFGICELLFVPTMIFTLRSGNIQRGAGASGVVLVFLMVPFAFFYNGGIHAGAPNWCIIALVFVTLTVKGRLRVFLLISDIVLTVVCYVLSWTHPELVDPFTNASAYVDSLASLIITGILIGIMFLFQLHMANQERAILERQQSEIMDMSRAQSRFFSSMSHEIRTPVNTIIGLNEMILREDVSDEVAEDAGQVRAAGKMLLHLVNDILDMSKLESGQMELSNTAYDLGDLFSEVVGMMWSLAQEKELAFHIDIDPALPARLSGDELRLRQILINVIGNAVKYTDRGSVSLSAQWKSGSAGSGSLVFQVSDTGRGIRKEDIPYLFTAFKRVETDANRAIEGTGLGLSIVKQLVDRMGGSVQVSSVYRKGSTFTVEIPQSDVGAGPIGNVDLESRHMLNRRVNYIRRFEAPQARVLVVDDNAPNRMVVTKLLRDTRMQLDTAASGEEALALTLQHHYALIFMDHLMPGMDGVTCLNRIRSQAGGLSKDARVVALTANADADSRQFYARKGFDGYLLKPCSGDELEKECLRLLPRELVKTLQGDSGIIETSISWMSESKRKEDIVITTDSIADLPTEIIRKYRIGILPHCVQTAEGFFRDGEEIESESLVAYLDGGNSARALPPTVTDYEAFFANQLSRANHVIHISISSRIAGSGYANAAEAAKAFHNVSVFDSWQLSSGQGLLVMEACRLMQEQLPAERIVQELAQRRDRIHSGFIVDSLSYLERANLISPRAAAVAQALMVRPVLVMKRGEIRIGGIRFGSRERAWRKYLAAELRSMDDADKSALFVTYVGLSPMELAFLRDAIAENASFDTVYFQKASPAIAVNCGAGTFGLLYQTR